MRLRKKEYSLQELGSKEHPQYYVALPSKWIRAHGLGKGDKLTLYYSVDTGEIILLVPGSAPISEVAFVRERVYEDA